MWESLEILELTSSLLVNDLNLSPLGAGSPIVISRADTEEGDLAIDTCCSIRAGIGNAVIIGWWCWGFRQSEKVELFYSLIMINFLIYLNKPFQVLYMLYTLSLGIPLHSCHKLHGSKGSHVLPKSPCILSLWVLFTISNWYIWYFTSVSITGVARSTHTNAFHTRCVWSTPVALVFWNKTKSKPYTHKIYSSFSCKKMILSYAWIANIVRGPSY